MSKQNNVNPNFYKDGGREHTEGADKGDSAYEPKGELAQSEKNAKLQGKEGQPNFIPGEPPVGESKNSK
jgi:hypothetical protein